MTTHANLYQACRQHLIQYMLVAQFCGLVCDLFLHVASSESLTDTLVDGAGEVGLGRFKSVISATISTGSSLPTGTGLEKFKCLRAPTLSHLLAMILHMPPSFMSEQTSLVVIDDLNILVDLDYPRQQFANSARTEQQKWQSSRRYAILGSIVSALNKLAVLNNLAVIVTTGCSTRMRPDSGLGSALGPGTGGTEWDAGIWNRLVVFRDFGGHFVGLQKSQGKSHISREEVGETGRVFAFETTSSGTLQERQPTKSADGATAALAKARISPVKPRKRAFDEIADSDGEEVDEYGWAEADDDAVAAEGLIDHDAAEESTTEPH